MPYDPLTAIRALGAAALLWAASPRLLAQDFPRPPDDPASIARGKQTFSVNCGFCHGSDARGGEGGGPNLLRSAIVLADHKGEILSAVVLNGRVDRGMPKFSLPDSDIADIAAFLHSLNIGRGAGEPMDPKRVLVGSANAGRAYFNGKGQCSKCHSATQDLAGIGSKYDAKTLQDKIFTGGATGMLGVPLPTAPPRTVKVSFPSGEMIAGTLVSIDDFVVVLIDAKGDRRTIPRNADTPKIQITNPLQAHVDMILRWEDRDLHDLTAYLATIK
jgi:cytochrome c oxidase cbb3-type subunit III